VTSEQDRPSETESTEPTEDLGQFGEPAPETEGGDTARLWEQPAPPAYPTDYPTDYQQPEYYAGYPAYEYHQPFQPPPVEAPAGPKARVPGWLWPVVAATALIVGTIGGAIGGTIVADGGDGNNAFFDTGNDNPQISEDETSAAPLPADNGSISAVAAKLVPSTVQVNANGGSGDGSGATGSGFVVDDAGHVITNNHVVEDATGAGEIEVVDHRGRSYSARIVGRSPVYDIAVLQVANAGSLTPAAIGSSKALDIGDGVVAIGSPLGLSSTVTSGIVSALDRPVTTGGGSGESSYINAVQTDAAINPGNSGGPLVNLRGQVVGVNSAIATTGGITEDSGSIGVGFAIPMEQVKVTANQILQTGEAQYPVIGAEVNTLPEKKGANIVTVNADAPAERAGLRKGDLVVAVDNKRVQDSIGLIVAIRTHQPGDTITLTLLRNGDQRQVDITLGAESDSTEQP
jgi:putative serine protease PepD